MDEVFKRFLDFLPIPFLLGVAAVVALAWFTKQLRPTSEYNETLRDKVFQRAVTVILAIVLLYLGGRYVWGRATAVDFNPGERGICVAEFKDDKDDVVQRHIIEMMKTLIADDPSLSTVRVEAYSGIPSSDIEARRLAERHHAVATVWGNLISDPTVHMVTFEVTPLNAQHGISKFCAKYPDIEDFTKPFVAFVRTSAPAAPKSQEDAQNSYVQQQIQELRVENRRLVAMVDQLQMSINSAESVRSPARFGGAPVDQEPNQNGPNKKRRFGLFIGINNYGIAGLQLRFSSPDALAMAGAFRAGFDGPNNVVTLTDSDATREHVLSSMEDISQRVQQDDQVWLYFSGIGFRYGNGESSYLALAGKNAENLQASSLSSDELLNWVKALKARQVVVFLDACHSGLGSSVEHRGLSDISGNRRTLDDRGIGRVFFAAAGADQLAFEDFSLGHGIFTYYLLKGLSGAADIRRDGHITSMELFEYVRLGMLDSSNGRNQNPYFGVIEGSGELTVADIKSFETKR